MIDWRRIPLSALVGMVLTLTIVLSALLAPWWYARARLPPRATGGLSTGGIAASRQRVWGSMPSWCVQQRSSCCRCT